MVAELVIIGAHLFLESRGKAGEGPRSSPAVRKSAPPVAPASREEKGPGTAGAGPGASMGIGDKDSGGLQVATVAGESEINTRRVSVRS